MMRISPLAAILLFAVHIFASPTPRGRNSIQDGHRGDDKKEGRRIVVKHPNSIQAVINFAKPGDTIIVEKGTYKEQLTIATSGITLIGKEAILHPPATFRTNICSGLNRNFANEPTEAGICIQGSDILLEDFSSEHRRFISAGKRISNVIVQGFTVQGFSGENIAVVAGENVKILRNTLLNGPQYSFLTVGSRNTLAERNTVGSLAVGFIAMCMDDVSGARYIRNDISGYYIALCTQTNGGLVKRNKVKDSCIGVFVDPNIDGAQVIGNTITDRGQDCPTFPAENNAGAGIIMFGAKNTLVEGNTIDNIHNNGTGVGILVTDGPTSGATGNVVKQNKLKNNDVDIFTDAKAQDTVFVGNKCQSSAPGDYCT
jgi:nitrous oxidase accessory protein NosD